jgi:glutamate synthase domain-containing protein 3
MTPDLTLHRKKIEAVIENEKNDIEHLKAIKKLIDNHAKLFGISQAQPLYDKYFKLKQKFFQL